MKTFGFYTLGFKGYQCLKSVISEFGPEFITFAVSARDSNIEKDFFNEIKELCLSNGILFNERTEPPGCHVDFRFAIGWRWIISDTSNLVIFHDSLLPRYRGFAPLVNALINGEKEIGVTALRASEHYDCGDIINQKSLSIEYPLKIEDAIAKIAPLYTEILFDICKTIISKQIINTYSQDQKDASYSPWRNELDYNVDWNKSAEYIARFIDAVGYPYKGAKTTANGECVRVLDCKVVKDVQVEARLEHIGKILFMHSNLPIVICGEGLLQLTNIVDVEGTPLIGRLPFRTRFGSY